MSLNSTGTTAYWGDETFPISDGTKHFLVVGDAGSGKTISLRLLMQSVLKHIGSGSDHRALVYDTRGDMYPLLAGMEPKCPIHILNPFDKRSAAWDIAADVTSLEAAHQLARSLIPDFESGKAFFTEAARNLFAALCFSFIKNAPANWTLRDVLLAVRNPEHLRSVLGTSKEGASLTQAYFANSRTSNDIVATLVAKLQPFEMVAACWEQSEVKISLTAWLESETVLLLSGNPLFERDLLPIYQSIFHCATGLILAQKETAAARTWIFLDQLGEALRFERLEMLLAAGRSKGACVAIAFQDIEKIRRLYGPDAADSITAACLRRTFLCTHSKETAEWASRLAGSVASPDGIHTTGVLPSDLMSLPMPGPDSGFHAFHQSLDGRITFSHKSWDWILANLNSPKHDLPPFISRP